jgi:hypothetical protein
LVRKFDPPKDVDAIRPLKFTQAYDEYVGRYRVTIPCRL